MIGSNAPTGTAPRKGTATDLLAMFGGVPNAIVERFAAGQDGQDPPSPFPGG